MVEWGLTVRGICIEDDKILLLQIRSKSVHDAQKWEIPGGKVKSNEFFDQSLIREFKEETNLDVEVTDFYTSVKKTYVACKTNQEVHSIQLIMKVTAKEDEITISSEHDNYKWFTKEEIKDLAENRLLTEPAIETFENIGFI